MVLVYPWIGCGVCRVCRDGYENLCMKPRCLGVHCDGGYSDQIVVPNSKYLLPLDGLDPVAVAPYACSGVTTYSALKKLGSRDQGRAGPGHRRRRPRPDVRDNSEGDGRQGRGRRRHRREAPRARRWRRARSPRSTAPRPTRWRRSTAALGGPCWAAIDLVGSPQTAALGFDSLAKGGKMIMVGLFGGSAPWSLPLIPMKAAAIEGSYTGNLAETRELLDLVRSGAIAEDSDPARAR